MWVDAALRCCSRVSHLKESRSAALVDLLQLPLGKSWLPGSSEWEQPVTSDSRAPQTPPGIGPGQVVDGERVDSRST